MEMIPISNNDLKFIQKLFIPNILEKNEKKYLILSKIELEILLEKLSTKLIKDGLHPNDEPNDLGIYMESLIDYFSSYYYNNS